SNGKDGTAKAMVADHISHAVQSTSNLLHLMQQSSPSQACLMKLPKNLVAKTSTIRNTAQVLEQLPQVISSLDAPPEEGLHSEVAIACRLGVEVENVSLVKELAGVTAETCALVLGEPMDIMPDLQWC
ncbi:hypothetical protein IFM89_015825, partial [Coptis chinensis]